MSCACHSHHHGHGHVIDVGELADMLVKCGPGGIRPPGDIARPGSADPTAGNTFCVTTGKTPKGCGPVGCFPGVHKFTCYDSLGNAEHYTHVDPV